MKKDKKKNEFLEQLRKTPVIQIAAEKVSISRNSVYKWRKEDPEFHKAMELALIEGEELINDISESTLLSLIKDRKWQALSFWLSHRHPKFTNKLKIEANINYAAGPLTPEEEAIKKEALEIATGVTSTNNNDNEQ